MKNIKDIKYLSIKGLDFKQMVMDIDKIASSNNCAELGLLLMPRSREITQEEAKQAIDMLGRIYMISHCLTCSSCNRKYRVNHTSTK